MQLITRMLEFGLLLYAASFFLTLGSDFPHQVYVRMWAGGLLFALFVPTLVKKIKAVALPNWAFRFFLCFLTFQVLRALLLRGFYVDYLYVWFFYFCFFALSYFFFDE